VRISVESRDDGPDARSPLRLHRFPLRGQSVRSDGCANRALVRTRGRNAPLAFIVDLASNPNLPDWSAIPLRRHDAGCSGRRSTTRI
jgi:hypothetical protein